MTNLDFFAKAPHHNITMQKNSQTSKNGMGYIVQWFNYVEDAFILDEEKVFKRLKLLQESYFIYDCRPLIKPSFISELNKLLPVYCSSSEKSELSVQIVKLVKKADNY